MNKAQLYLIKDIIFFVPTVSSGRMISQMVEPFTCVSINETSERIGEQFISTLENSKTVDELPNGNGAFRKFLKTTKMGSNVKLIKNAKYIRVDFDNGRYLLLRVGASLKHKAFAVDLGIPPKEIDLIHCSLTEIGSQIKELFLMTK